MKTTKLCEILEGWPKLRGRTVLIRPVGRRYPGWLASIRGIAGIDINDIEGDDVTATTLCLDRDIEFTHPACLFTVCGGAVRLMKCDLHGFQCSVAAKGKLVWTERYRDRRVDHLSSGQVDVRVVVLSS